MATTLADLRRHVGLTFGLDQTLNSDEYKLMNDWANEGVRDVLLNSHCRVELGDQLLTVGIADYRMDDEIMAVDDRTITANSFLVQLISIEEMYGLRRASAAAGATIKLAAEGDLLLVWPTPSDATTIRYVYVRKPTEMTADAHDLCQAPYGALPLFGFQAVRDYMNWRAALYDERKSPHAPEDYHTFYRQTLTELRRRTRRMAGRRMPPMSTGYPPGGSAGRRNDEYPVY